MRYFRLAILIPSALIFASAGSITANAQREGGAFFGPFATGNSSGGNFAPAFCGIAACKPQPVMRTKKAAEAEGRWQSGSKMVATFAPVLLRRALSY
jgi:hypothetical protein